MDVKFKHGTWAAFNNLAEKDPGTLYVLDNSQLYKGDMLLSSVHTVGLESRSNTDDAGFPNTPTSDMRENFYISLKNGEIRFVTEDLQYRSISQIMTDNLILDQNFLNTLIKSLANTADIIMPTLTVDEHMLKWSGSNVDKITVFTPK